MQNVVEIETERTVFGTRVALRCEFAVARNQSGWRNREVTFSTYVFASLQSFALSHCVMSGIGIPDSLSAVLVRIIYPCFAGLMRFGSLCLGVVAILTHIPSALCMIFRLSEQNPYFIVSYGSSVLWPASNVTKRVKSWLPPLLGLAWVSG